MLWRWWVNSGYYKRVSRQAKEMSLMMVMLIMMILMVSPVVEVILIILLKFRNLECRFGAGNGFLGVDLVESIDKGAVFDLDYSTNR